MSQLIQIVVKKFGGSSVSTAEKIRNVAGFIKATLKPREKYLVVVSAMGKTTNELLGLAKEVAKDPCKREQDMLLSCGERTSMALLAMALKDIGIKSQSLTGSQSGIITDNIHGGANIETIKPVRVLQSFEEHDVVIIAGFQGVSHEKEVTTLRRGGSDTTAVAMAKALNASACEIYTDVPGIMTADPNLFKEAVMLPVVTFDDASSMALYGAKVLAYDAALLAKENDVPLKIAATLSLEGGTEVVACAFTNPLRRPVKAITHHADLCRVQILLSDFLGTRLSFDEAAFIYLHQTMLIGFVPAAKADSHAFGNLVEKDVRFALVALHIEEEARMEMLHKAVSTLLTHGIALEAMQQQVHELLFIVPHDQCKKAVQILHESFIDPINKGA